MASTCFCIEQQYELSHVVSSAKNRPQAKDLFRGWLVQLYIAELSRQNVFGVLASMEQRNALNI